jgi:hypothetical protein
MEETVISPPPMGGDCVVIAEISIKVVIPAQAGIQN